LSRSISDLTRATWPEVLLFQFSTSGTDLLRRLAMQRRGLRHQPLAKKKLPNTATIERIPSSVKRRIYSLTRLSRLHAGRAPAGTLARRARFSRLQRLRMDAHLSIRRAAVEAHTS